MPFELYLVVGSVLSEILAQFPLADITDSSYRCFHHKKSLVSPNPSHGEERILSLRHFITITNLDSVGHFDYQYLRL